jgi:hypothetical protein
VRIKILKLPSIPLNISMLQLETFIIDYTHNKYKRKNGIGKKSFVISYVIIPSQSNFGKFQNPNKTRQETHT